MPVLAPGDADYAVEVFCAHQCDYKFSYAARVRRLQTSFERLSVRPLNVMLLL